MRCSERSISIQRSFPLTPFGSLTEGFRFFVGFGVKVGNGVRLGVEVGVFVNVAVGVLVGVGIVGVGVGVGIKSERITLNLPRFMTNFPVLTFIAIKN